MPLKVWLNSPLAVISASRPSCTAAYNRQFCKLKEVKVKLYFLETSHDKLFSAFLRIQSYNPVVFTA
ncbi:MAG: hypothetical protein A2W85_10415 [Bacteroidetes bacterium GWF2_41_31]|nr:MAG: hypothetical protein A2W85_10415 [Bacteroidetes bacterium GWF2_41_31]